MKKHIKLLLFLFLSASAFAQNYGNEWINYSQQYYAFNVYQTGIFRLNQSELVAANIPTGSFSSQNIQIFGKEKEIPLLIVDGNDNSMDPGDYILFYAQRNDGWIDSLIYRQPGDIANPGYSLYNDTIQYFFTWNSSTANKRFVVDPDVNFGAYTQANYVLKELFSTSANLYSEGYKQDKASGSIYAPGEGWGILYDAVAPGSGDGLGIVPMPTHHPYTGSDAPAASLHVSTVSNSSSAATSFNNHHLRMDMGTSNFPLIDSAYYYYKMIKFDRAVPPSVLNPGVTNLTFRIINDLGAVMDRISLNYYRLIYARGTHANGEAYDNFSVPFNTGGPKTFIDLQGLNSASPVVFTFGAVPTAATPVLSGSSWQFLVPNAGAGTPTKVVLGDVSSFTNVSGLEAVNGTGQFTDFSALSTEAAVLMIYHPKLQLSTAAYANYRSSAAGGGHNVILANINELYQQYGGGIEKHVIAIRRFALHAYNLATVKPAALFLMGKGITENGGTRQSAVNFANSLIPAFGYPASDIPITAGLLGTQWDPLIPTGRISVNTNSMLQEYLDKVIEYESVQGPNSPVNADWQKQILHFVGGSDAQQQTAFGNYMDGMAATIEDTLFAGNVTTYRKTSSDPLDPNVVAGVTERISNGVSLMNFFGHAAASNHGFEINIDDPSNWNNTGKYPIILGNSCYNGDLYNPDLSSTSELFVNLPNEGAIAFISSTFVGYDSPLNIYSSKLYEHFSYLSYGEPIGLQMQRTIRAIQQFDPSHTQTINETTSTQMALNGDPMLRLNWHSAPEIEITQQGLYFEPTNLNLTVDTIDLFLIVKNLGKSITSPFNVEIRRNFPGIATDSVYNITVPHLNYKDTLHLRFPMQPNIGLGENLFTVNADIPSFIPEEHDEFGNNSITKTLFVRVDGILPVYPYDFAVVPKDTVTVKASTIDPIADVKTYLFELDTVHYYNSPQLRRFSITDVGGVKEVKPDQWKNANGNPFPLVCTDSTVYFWRVAVDSSVLAWNEYSFQYIPGEEGWGQDHFFQFKKNNFYGVVYDTLNRRRTFNPPEAHEVAINVYDVLTPANAWYLDGAYREYGNLFSGLVSGIYVFVLDPITLHPWQTRYLTENPDHGFGNGNDNPLGLSGIGHNNRADSYFAFRQDDPAQLAAFSNMIENEIPVGHYVGIYATTSALYSEWDVLYPPIYNTFQNTIGTTLINNSQPEKPFALFYRNGFPASLVQKHYPDTTADGYVRIVDTIYESTFAGIEKTPLIGPSANWETVFWRRTSTDALPADSIRLYIEAYDINQAQQFTIDTVFTPNDSIIHLNNLVPAAQYPYLRLGIYNDDDLFFTPAQIDRLHVLYQPGPEAAIDGSTAYFINPLTDTLNEGQEVAFAVDVRNISAYDMDSLLVRYWVEDVNRVRHYIPYERQDSLRAGAVLRDTIHFSTLNRAGLNSLWMEVNPYINGSSVVTDQPEQYHFNNLLQLPFYVSGDDIHPILDVTFNGRHILNKDIIDPESEILITLKDDNPWLLMSQDADTSLFGIYLTDPAGNQRRIPFQDVYGNTVMQWIPAAQGQNNKFKIIYPAVFPMDGIYTLFVQGTDKSGNISGDIEYRISFEVIHESSITFMMNYPNPFSTSTRFIFTLTGSEEPDDMIIQIMTVTGRVVREITEAEIGRITIGRNISEYAWDGTDEFGDPLANGVYLYRVKAKINGEDIKHRESGADSHFKKEFGKMYLMR